jgi:hypothetical protein
VGVKCSKAITRSEITRGFRVSENLLRKDEVVLKPELIIRESSRRRKG